MDGVGSLLIEVILLAVTLVLACRWTFGHRGVRRTTPGRDYGLLSPVLRTDTVGEAQAARDRLAAAGLRATIAPAGRGFTAAGRPWPVTAQMVLVFPTDRIVAESVLRPTRQH